MVSHSQPILLPSLLLGPPARLLFMHLSQPGLRGPGHLVPANDDSPVSPSLVLDHLAHSEVDMRWPSGSRLDALAEISVFISEHENLRCLFISGKIFQTIFYHLFSRTFTIGVVQTVRVQNIFYVSGEDSVTPDSPGIQPQPRVSHLIKLIDELWDGVRPAGLCAAHVAGYQHLERNTHHYHSKLQVFSLERHLLSPVYCSPGLDWLARLSFIFLTDWLSCLCVFQSGSRDERWPPCLPACLAIFLSTFLHISVNPNPGKWLSMSELFQVS